MVAAHNRKEMFAGRAIDFWDPPVQLELCYV
jgi:hypothetical protein